MSRYDRRYNRSRGHERALQHILEARELSEELGGTDKDVKEYFFSLSAQELESVLNVYELENGHKAREYAEETMAKWRSGRVKMSGLVAGRLFRLLPPRMPLGVKHSLVKTLWEKYSPRSNKRIRIGPDALEQDIISAVQSHLLETVINYTIPEPLERRFKWLSDGDVDIKQQLLNYYLDIEKSLIIEGTQKQLPVMLTHLRQHGAITQKLSQKIQIGNHQIELCFDTKATGFQFEDPMAYRTPSKSGCLVMAAFIFTLIILVITFW